MSKEALGIRCPYCKSEEVKVGYSSDWTLQCGCCKATGRGVRDEHGTLVGREWDKREGPSVVDEAVDDTFYFD